MLVRKDRPALSRLKLFFALSRTTHILLDLSTPALGALLSLGKLPSWEIPALGLATAFAGYTAVYALNDLVDSGVDREKMNSLDGAGSSYDLDALYSRHPVAQGLLSFKAGLLWVCSWALAALAGAYLLRPVCAFIFLLGALLEATYCLLLKISHLRIIISGMVKSAGAIAAVFAVGPGSDMPLLLLLFGFIFFWEIGGQNIPNDWADVHSDRLLGAKTVPVMLGLPAAGVIAVSANILAVACSILLGLLVPFLRNSIYLTGVLITGMVILVLPSCRLYRTHDVRHAAALFNRASFYPLLILVLVVICLILP